MTGGIVVLLDNKPDEPENLIATTTSAIASTPPASGADTKMDVEEEEAPLPEPFTYPFGDE